MKSLVLHVGYPKSGSSALQVALRREASALEAKGISYPLLDQREIASIERRGFGSGNAIFLAEALKRGLRLPPLLKKIEAAEGDHVILATESFGQVNREQIKPLTNWMHGLGVPVRTIAYQRSPFDLVLSGYSQSVKRGRMRKTLVAAAGAFKDPQQRIRDVFADWQIDERSYMEHRHDLVNDFLQWVTPVAPRITMPPKPTTRSLSLEEIIVIKRLNTSEMDKHDIDAVVSKLLKDDMYGSPLVHTREAVEALCRATGLDPEKNMHHVGHHCLQGLNNADLTRVSLRVVELLAELASERAATLPAANAKTD
jgi:hypothetical protein